CNRIVEINELTLNSPWHHCPGKLQPADIISRGCLADQLMKSTFWLNGPDWLYNDIDFDNMEPNCPLKELDAINVYKSEFKRTKIVCLTVIEQNFDICKYGDLNKATRVLGYVLRCLKFIKPVTQILSTIELEYARQKLIFIEQRKYFSSEIESFVNKKPLPKNSTLLTLD
ncbi:unnamed protein product, partial [Meganyctiphanes norvegica]